MVIFQSYVSLPVVPARGGGEVALGIYYKTFLIPHFTLQTALFALHTSLHTALLRVHTSHFTLQS